MKSAEQLNKLRIELEEGVKNHLDDYNFFKNLINNVDEKYHNLYCKSLILILYANFEGFIKFSFLAYINYINSLNIKLSETNYTLAALTLHNEFKNYDQLNSNSQYSSDDTPLKRVKHRKTLLEQLDNYSDKIISIKDNTIETKSNLNYKNLQTILCKFGINDSIFKDYKQEINNFVNIRNNVAHGSSVNTFTYTEFLKIEDNIKKILNDIPRLLYNEAKNSPYKNM